MTPAHCLPPKGYDSDAIRRDLRDRGTAPGNPDKKQSEDPSRVDKALYAIRCRIECCNGHLKE